MSTGGKKKTCTGEAWDRLASHSGDDREHHDNDDDDDDNNDDDDVDRTGVVNTNTMPLSITQLVFSSA